MCPEEVTEIFAQTLAGDYNDDVPWNAVEKLRVIASREVLDRAEEWCSSDDPLKRARGADILAQIGNTPDHPGNIFPEESVSVVSAMVRRETDLLALRSTIHALGHIGNSLAIPLIIEHLPHSSADVRFAVACALGSFANETRTVDALLKLMQDADEDVRDWATFNLGVIGDADSPEIRDALVQRMCDPNRNVRVELNQPEISDCVIEAAQLFLGESDRRENWTPDDYITAIKKRFSL